MPTLYEEDGLVKVEFNPSKRLVILSWRSLHGPHYRKGLNAMLAEVKKLTVTTLISDTSIATGVQSAEDLAYVDQIAKQLVAFGVKRYIVVTPQSAIARMGTTRIAKTVASLENKIERAAVATLDEALRLADGKLAA